WILSILQTDKALESLTEQHKLIDQAYETNERLIHVVNDLLNVSRIQEGRLPYNPQPSDIIGMVRELCVNVERLYQAKGVRLETDLQEGIPMLELDPILFKEAIQNLLDNAMDYNQPADGWVRVVVRREGERVFLKVINAG